MKIPLQKCRHRGFARAPRPPTERKIQFVSTFRAFASRGCWSPARKLNYEQQLNYRIQEELTLKSVPNTRAALEIAFYHNPPAAHKNYT